MVGLGDLPGGSFLSGANAISSDGITIVGVGRSGNDQGTDLNEAFRWTSEGGMQGLGFLPGGSFSNAFGVSSDGSTIVGWAAGQEGGGAFLGPNRKVSGRTSMSIDSRTPGRALFSSIESNWRRNDQSSESGSFMDRSGATTMSAASSVMRSSRVGSCGA